MVAISSDLNGNNNNHKSIFPLQDPSHLLHTRNYLLLISKDSLPFNPFNHNPSLAGRGILGMVNLPLVP